MLLRVDFTRVQNILYGTVLHQDESIRCIYEQKFSKLLCLENNFSVFSKGNPGIEYDKLYVRGLNRDRDYNYFCFAYDTDEMAVLAHSVFDRLIERINNGTADRGNYR